MAGKKKCLYFLFFLMMLCMITSGMINAQRRGPEEQLTQFIAELQQTPDDNALREKIIKLALTLDPPPAVPEAVKRSMARGIAAIKSANESGDFTDAVAEFQKAALAAPWLANVYNNLGIAQDKAGQFEEAISSLKLYLLAAPLANDAEEVKSLIYEIEYRQEKAAMKHSEQETEPIVDKAAPMSIEGDWAFTYMKQDGSEGQIGAIRVTRTSGGWDIVKLDSQGNEQGEDTYPRRNITGSDTMLEWDQRYGYKTEMDFHHELTLSRDGASVTWVQTTRESGHPEMNSVSKWKRVKK